MILKFYLSEEYFHSKYFIILVFSTLPVLNFASFNVGESGFSLMRALGYIAIIILAGLIVVRILRFFFAKTSEQFLSLFIGLSIFVTLNGYMIDSFVFSNTFEDLGLTPRIRHIILIYCILIIITACLSKLIADRKTLLSILLFSVSASAIADIYIYSNSLIKTSNSSKNQLSSHVPSTHKNDNSYINTKSKNIANIDSELTLTNKNVYFIIPDMMVGREMFMKYGIDVTILDGIKNRGFKIPDKSYSNAPVTAFSLPHIFSMNYYLQDGMQIATNQMEEIMKIYKKGNQVYKEFKQRGYTIHALHDGYYPNCGRGEDVCIKNTYESNDYQKQDSRFIERTPFFKALNVLDMKYSLFITPMNLWAHPNRMEVPKILEYLPDPYQGPIFTYIHIALPHYPLRFNRNCEYQRFDNVPLAYTEQYYCAVTYLELLIDSIIDKDKDALIVIHSDHGVSFSGQHLKQVNELSDAEIVENLSIFSSFRLPQECSDYVTDDITPVNTFRLVFACLDGTNPNFIENKSFLVYYPKWKPSNGHVREWYH